MRLPTKFLLKKIYVVLRNIETCLEMDLFSDTKEEPPCRLYKTVFGLNTHKTNAKPNDANLI